MREYMIDLETINNTSSSAIISVGIVKFNLEDEDSYDTLDENGRSFYCVLDVQDQIDLGRTVGYDTLQWWMRQGKLAQAVFQEEPTFSDNAHAIDSMNNFMLEEGRLWGNGASFDNVIIREFYQTYGREFPIEFWNDMCFRTLKNSAPRKVAIDRGVAHNALEDAKYQVLLAQAYWKMS